MSEEGVWRTVRGHRVLIKSDGTIVSKNKALDGKKLSKKTEKEDNTDKELTKEEMIEKYDLKDEELEALESYTLGGYAMVNYRLRRDAKGISTNLEESKEKIRNIDSALSKLPKHEGVVYRKEYGDIDYQEGKIYKNHAFTSTTKWSSVSGLTWIQIEQSSGRDISKLSKLPGEAEVLIPRGFMFKVEKVEHLEDGYTKVYAKEVKRHAERD